MPRTRALTCAVLGGVLGALMAAAPAHADPGDPSQPFCTQAWTDGTHIGYTSTGQTCVWGVPIEYYQCVDEEGFYNGTDVQVMDDDTVYFRYCMPRIL